MRKGLKFEDGTPITSKDVKYARRAVTGQGDASPTARRTSTQFLELADGLQGPVQGQGHEQLDSAIETPDDQTIVFHLKQPFAGVRLPRACSRRRPRCRRPRTPARSTRSTSISTGPYKFEDTQPGKGFTLVRNPELGPGDRPEPQGAAGQVSTSSSTSNADDIDNRLIAGDLDVDVAGTGVQPAALSRVLGDPTLKAHADNPTLARLWYTSINPTVEPLDNIDCRKAVKYAMDHDVLPDRVRRPVRRWRHRDDAAAADHPGLPEVRPVPDARTTRVT